MASVLSSTIVDGKVTDKGKSVCRLCTKQLPYSSMTTKLQAHLLEEKSGIKPTGSVSAVESHSSHSPWMCTFFLLYKNNVYVSQPALVSKGWWGSSDLSSRNSELPDDTWHKPSLYTQPPHTCLLKVGHKVRTGQQILTFPKCPQGCRLKLVLTKRAVQDHTHTHTHICTSTLVRALIDIMHSLAPYPNRNLIRTLKPSLHPQKAN